MSYSTFSWLLNNLDAEHEDLLPRLPAGTDKVQKDKIQILSTDSFRIDQPLENHKLSRGMFEVLFCLTRK